MGLDIELCRVMSKGEVTKLKNKYGVTDLIYPEQSCDELDKISFIEIEHLISCDTNIATFNMFKHCLAEQEIGYYNVTAMLLESKVKTKDQNLSNYFITGLSSSSKGENYTEFKITHRSDKKDIIEVDILDDKIKNLEYRAKELGIFIQDVEYIQRKGINVNKTLTGKCYRDEIFELFISTESQLEKLNKNNEYKDCVLKRDFKIPKNHLLYINW